MPVPLQRWTAITLTAAAAVWAALIWVGQPPAAACSGYVPGIAVVCVPFIWGAVQSLIRGELKLAMFVASASVVLSGYQIYSGLAHPHGWFF